MAQQLFSVSGMVAVGPRSAGQGLGRGLHNQSIGFGVISISLSLIFVVLRCIPKTLSQTLEAKTRHLM